ncbi:hypothetical protein [Saccharothrix algeriensis]|uniref:Uncharacterized protein n=1 Tax=Saccharothrix algeriensis TaxID=173560 RepID=A0A8T8HS40_9PSEU|nr:hypothetical protein [Saccharothrix algeriensis]MBM7812584.1 hypothetical protein [Saccharothrix algeriensis]QTR01306.1 hypothetical protein J7S33_17740 [Saccharothrix algeriensis]
MTAATPAANASGAPAPRLHQPKRALVAVGEVVVAAGLVLLAVWCWNRGVLRHSYPVEGRAPLESTRYLGNWIGAAVGLGTAAGVLVLDAARQTVLALRTRGREEAAEPDV